MTPDDLERLLAERGARIAQEQARQAEALKAAKVGPWAPSLVAMKPRVSKSLRPSKSGRKMRIVHRLATGTRP